MKRGGVRIAGGAHRGRVLTVPSRARPTEGRVREALFAIWQDRIEGARFLDLFAGSGAVAFEAAGRGALEVVAVESDRRTLKGLAAARRTLGEGILTLWRARLPAGLEELAAHRDGRPFDLVFADPPYGFTAYQQLLDRLAPLLAADAEVAVEHSSRARLPEEAGDLVRVDVRRYGETALSFYRLRPA